MHWNLSHFGLVGVASEDRILTMRPETYSLNADCLISLTSVE